MKSCLRSDRQTNRQMEKGETKIGETEAKSYLFAVTFQRLVFFWHILFNKRHRIWERC